MNQNLPKTVIEVTSHDLFGAGSSVTITKTGVTATVARKGPFAYGSTEVPETWVQLTKEIKHPVNLRWTDMIHCRHLTPGPGVAKPSNTDMETSPKQPSPHRRQERLVQPDFDLIEVDSGTTIESACKTACEQARRSKRVIRFEWSSGAKTLTVEILPGTKLRDAVAEWKRRMDAPAPLGVYPRYVWIENRRRALEMAIARFKEAGCDPSKLWDELDWLNAEVSRPAAPAADPAKQPCPAGRLH